MLNLLFSLVRAEDMTPSGIPVSQLPDKIDEYIEKFIGKKIPSCVISIWKDGHLTYNKSYGFSNVSENKVPTMDTLYEWGSITKVLTHVSIMQLYEQGKLKFDEDVRKYLPNGFFKKMKNDTNLTIFHLFSHTSGWDESVFDSINFTMNSTPHLGAYLQKNEPYRYAKPGEHVAYSNYGIALEGYIVERITQQPFWQYVQDNIFKKLGMNHTSLDPSRKDLPDFYSLDRAQGYTGYNKKKKEFEMYKHPNAGIVAYPSGSAVGSMHDLETLMNELRPNHTCRLLNESTLELFLSISHRSCDFCQGNAHGLWEKFYGDDQNGNTIKTLGHSGSTSSFSTNAEFDTVTGWSIYVMTNIVSMSDFVQYIPSIIFGTYNRSTPDMQIISKDVAKTYLQCRSFHHGIIKIFSSFLYATSFSLHGNDIKLSKTLILEQVGPNHFIAKKDNNDEFGNSIVFTFYKDKKSYILSLPYGDQVPISKNSINSQIFALVLLGISFLGLVASIILFIGTFFKTKIVNDTIGILNLPFLFCQLFLILLTVFSYVFYFMMVTRLINYGNVPILRDDYNSKCKGILALAVISFVLIIPESIILIIFVKRFNKSDQQFSKLTNLNVMESDDGCNSRGESKSITYIIVTNVFLIVFSFLSHVLLLSVQAHIPV